MIVLGIETSCDETGVAVYSGEAGLLAHAVHSQIALHAEYGGVVPELASRDHVRKLIPLIDHVLDEAGLSPDEIDGVAYTAGPGLMGALLVGAAVGRSMAYAWGCPALGVHHMEGHLLVPMLDADDVEFPFLALLVSGGHSQLVNVEGVGRYQVIGESLDDAAGEAFDKTAKLLGLGYPGGPALARVAEQGTPRRFVFPRPMTDRPGLDMSFSGLKTHAMTTFNASDASEQTKADIALAFEVAVAETMAIKCRRALEQTGLRCLVIAGGVGANRRLRRELEELGQSLGVRVVYPPFELCTDNGAMIAFAGYQRLVAGQQVGLSFKTQARWSMETLSAL